MPSPPQSRICITVQMPQDLRDRLQAVADEEDRKISALVRHICKRYLDERDQAK